MKLVKDIPIVSPLLIKLLVDIKASKNKKSELEKFWKYLDKVETPIYEELEEEPDYYLVTFIYRQLRLTKELYVNSSIFGRIETRGRMKQIPETDIYYKSIFILRKSRVSYCYVKGIINCPVYFGESTGEFDIHKDPLNSKFIHYVFSIYNLDIELSLLETPDCEPQKWIVKDNNLAEGTMKTMYFKSPEMEVLLGGGKVKESISNGYTIEVYLPPNYDKEKQYGTITVFDEDLCLREDYLNMKTVLDNLINHGEISPVIGIFIHQINRNIELLFNKTFGDFITQEVISEIRKMYRLYDDPKYHVVYGVSFGGIMSMFMGLEYSQFFGNVLCQSGSFSMKPVFDFSSFSDDNREGYQHLIEEYVVKDKVDINIYMMIGRYEGKEALFGTPSHYWSNIHMRDVLRLKKYKLRFVEDNINHFVFGWRDTLVEGLIYLLGSK